MIGRRDPLRDELSALDELDQEARRPVRRPTSLIIPILITMIVMTGGVTIAWYSYNAGVKEGSEGAAPLLKPSGPMKVAPDNPGGANIPHQEMTVYQSLNEQKEGAPVERILPPPERPLLPPAAAPAAGESSRVRSADTVPGLPPTAESPKAPDAAPAPGARSLIPPAAAPAPSKPPQLALNQPKAAEPAVKEVRPAPVKPVDKTVRAAPVKPAAEEQVASIPTGAYRIQLGSVSSESQATKFWGAQRDKNGDLLGKLALSVEKTAISGKVYYRIQAGPLKDAASARTLCDQLKQRQIGCFIVNPKK
jgi:hypothetical protein